MRNAATAIMVVVILGLVALGFVLDRVAPTAEAAPTPAPAEATVAGAWICAVGDTSEGSRLALTAVAPPSAGGHPSALATTVFGEGELRSRTTGRVFPNSAASIGIDEGIDEMGTIVRWRDEAAAVFRHWTVEGEGRPSGLVGGPCQAEPNDRWVVPGVSTSGGAQAHLHLANPFGSAASVAIDLTTPEGVVSPRRLENVVVPARAIVRVTLNEHVPERSDVGVIVTARSGRVVTEAVQTYDAAIGGIEGRSLALATSEPGESWTIPTVEVGEDRASWLWITNPSDRPSAVVVSLHTADGGIVPEGMEELSVDPGTTQRIDLTGLVEDADVAAASVSVENGVPIVVSGATQYEAEREARTGITVTLGASELDPTWVLAPGEIEDRMVNLDLVNPSGSEATVDIAIWTGSNLERPEDLAGVSVPPGGTARLDLTSALADVGEPTAVIVTATEGEIAAGIHAFAPERRRNAVAFAGVPSSIFRTPAGAPAVRFAPTLPVRIGTPYGPEGVMRLDDLGTGDTSPDELEAPATEPSP